MTVNLFHHNLTLLCYNVTLFSHLGMNVLQVLSGEQELTTLAEASGFSESSQQPS